MSLAATGPKTFAIMNQKGGVGKTTTAVNLSAALAMREKNVLLIDLDPQGHATIGVGANAFAYTKTSYDALLSPKNVNEMIGKTLLPFLDILPSNQHLSGAEIELVPLEKREKRLKYALENLHKNYDYIFVDCPPSLGLLTVNALIASHNVVVPLQCEFYALDGLSHLLRTMQSIRRNSNPYLHLWGLVFTMFDRRSLHQKQVVAETQKVLNDKILHPPIPRNIAVAEAASFGKPVIVYDEKALGSVAYLELTDHFLKRDQSRQTIC